MLRENKIYDRLLHQCKRQPLCLSSFHSMKVAFHSTLTLQIQEEDDKYSPKFLIHNKSWSI